MRYLLPRIPTLAVSVLIIGCVAEGPIKTALTPAMDIGNRLGLSSLPLGGSTAKEQDTYVGERSRTEESLRTQARKFDRTVWEGALIGAAAGSLIGAVTGGETKDILTGAAVGAGVGALAGVYVANKQKRYAAAEDQLDSMISDVKQSNRETKELIADARKVLAEDKRRLADVKRRQARGKATEAELSQARSRAQSNRDVVQKASKGAKEQLGLYEQAEVDFRKAHDGANTAAYKSEVGKLRRNINDLDEIVDVMARA